MQIGTGLPTTIPNVQAEQVFDWARRADRHGFSSLGTIDRIVYGNIESLVALAAVAGVTERIKLVTSIALAPLHGPAALLAKQAASIDHLSGGRLVLGLAVGGREDDYQASGVSFKDRGRWFDQALDEMHKIWAGEARGYAGAIGPTPPKGRVSIVIGGTVDSAFERAATWGEGWIAGGGGPDMFRQGAEQARAAWSARGREGQPRLMGLTYWALGPDAREHADRYLHDYYGFVGEWADQIAASALTDEGSIREAVAKFEEAGCDELIMFPCNPDPQQVDLLAGVVL
jgi:alkanesulfonate monooxygenase SsuD/methylene tetrahydromethanopterin reductase-like flavin-dependent oxidoreductase (luciferase family)